MKLFWIKFQKSYYGNFDDKGMKPQTITYENPNIDYEKLKLKQNKLQVRHQQIIHMGFQIIILQNMLNLLLKW